MDSGAKALIENNLQFWCYSISNLIIHLFCVVNLQVAVKVLEKSRIKEKKDVERISREIKILKQLHHPNVVQIYEIIETEQDLYLVMEFVQGGELFDLIV